MDTYTLSVDCSFLQMVFVFFSENILKRFVDKFTITCDTGSEFYGES
jgi:hypothetical protein